MEHPESRVFGRNRAKDRAEREGYEREEATMKRGRFAGAQITSVLKDADAGNKRKEIRRKNGVTLGHSHFRRLYPASEEYA